MLLSSEPDMIHGGLLHRAKPQTSADISIIPHFLPSGKGEIAGNQRQNTGPVWISIHNLWICGEVEKFSAPQGPGPVMFAFGK